MLDLTNPKVITELLATERTKTKKHLGQHLLISKKTINKIVDAVQLTKTETILEIGPGIGVLTVELAQKAKKVVAIEMDADMVSVLQKNITTLKLENIDIIRGDALAFKPSNLEPKTYHLVSNLPYQITSPVLWKFLHEEKNKPAKLVIMIQKEVADRIVAKPGDMSLLSVLVQYYADVKVVCNVPRGQFFPPPKVDSTVIMITPKKGLPNHDHHAFMMFVKAGFANKRKMLKNNVASLVADPELLAHIQNVTGNEKARAQELSVAQWAELFKIVYNENN